MVTEKACFVFFLASLLFSLQVPKIKSLLAEVLLRLHPSYTCMYIWAHTGTRIGKWRAALSLDWDNQTGFLRFVSCMVGKWCRFLFALASSVISQWSLAACSVPSAICCSSLVCTILNHLILKFKSGRGSLWWKIVIWEKGKSRARSPFRHQEERLGVKGNCHY